MVNRILNLLVTDFCHGFYPNASARLYSFTYSPTLTWILTLFQLIKDCYKYSFSLPHSCLVLCHTTCWLACIQPVPWQLSVSAASSICDLPHSSCYGSTWSCMPFTSDYCFVSHTHLHYSRITHINYLCLLSLTSSFLLLILYSEYL